MEKIKAEELARIAAQFARNNDRVKGETARVSVLRAAIPVLLENECPMHYVAIRKAMEAKGWNNPNNTDADTNVYAYLKENFERSKTPRVIFFGRGIFGTTLHGEEKCAAIYNAETITAAMPKAAKSDKRATPNKKEYEEVEIDL